MEIDTGNPNEALAHVLRGEVEAERHTGYSPETPLRERHDSVTSEIHNVYEGEAEDTSAQEDIAASMRNSY